MEAHALTVENLSVEFRTPRGTVRANDGVSYFVQPGETLALLGESGSGKSVSARAVMGLFQAHGNVSVTADVLQLGDVDLRTLTERQWRPLRGRRLAMVSQDALAALNPVFPVGWQIAEVIRNHDRVTKRAALSRAVELLDRVGIPAAARRARAYPHEFSGGMRQRAMIAMALSLGPSVLVADEPTTALDVTVQRGVMELLRSLQRDSGLAILLITHDFGIVAEYADRVAVMYGGSVVETAATPDILRSPMHPYTEGLLRAVPSATPAGERLYVIPGRPPDLSALPTGCPFAPRCAYRGPECTTSRPPLVAHGTGRLSACFFAAELVHGGER